MKLIIDSFMKANAVTLLNAHLRNEIRACKSEAKLNALVRELTTYIPNSTDELVLSEWYGLLSHVLLEVAKVRKELRWPAIGKALLKHLL